MKVGDYVRTEDGIDIIEGYRYEPEYENGHVVWFKKSDSGCRYTDKDLPKSSPNIIGLIEVGDYVNGYKVLNIYNDKVIESIRVGIEHQIIKDYTSKDIKSIVTKEQFESMEYKIGE